MNVENCEITTEAQGTIRVGVYSEKKQVQSHRGQSAISS